jgi:DNA-binding NarL/FixJ family response regulator
MLATVLGDWERAESHFEAALALNRELGARTWLAHTRHEFARMLLARGRAADRAAASGLLRDALALAREIGAMALAARVGALAGEPDGRAAPPDDLSLREVEILRLVARGLSNRQIGAELFISEHTVANHIRSILRKTRCANRTEATAYAHRRGLTAARG